MIILEKPYVSDFLIETIKNNNLEVLDNDVARKYFPVSCLTNPISAVEKYNHGELFYTNSENSIDWVEKNLKNSNLKQLIEICKNKVLFRKSINKLYPKYFFKEVSLYELPKIDPETLVFPLVLKPSVGFLSFGVYPIKNLSQWHDVLSKIQNDIKMLEGIYPKSVVNTSNFIIEEMIEGEEFALDAYYNAKGEAVILDILAHPFFDEKDVSDRAYYTNKEIFEKYYQKFLDVLNKIGKTAKFKNFPFHIELRVNNESIIPIEINPMRFAGWCITDIAKYAWNINPYEYYLKQLKPNWRNIMKNADNSYYYFTIGDVPKEIEAKNVDYDNFLNNISEPLDIRKIDYKSNPLFAIVFAKTNSINEIKNILKLDMKEFIY